MNYVALVKAIDSAHCQLQSRAALAVNHALVIRNWLVGAYVVEFEQTGKERAKYGARLLEKLAADLARRQIRGLEIRNLRHCRLLYLRFPQLRHALPAELALAPGIFFTGPSKTLAIPGASAPLREVTPSNSADGVCRIRGKLALESPDPLAPTLVLRLSWSKLVELLSLDDEWKRAFY